jgi:hypothetical protein
MQLSIPDRIPLYEMATSPTITSKVLGKKESEVLIHNGRAFYDLVASGRNIDVDKLNEHVAQEMLTLYRKLGLDWIRGVGAYVGIPKEVRKIDESTWLVDGRKQRWSGESMWDLDEPKTYDPNEMARAYRSYKFTINPKTFDVLRRIIKEVKGKMFVSFDADGTWGPIVSNPNLLMHVLVWVYRRPDVVEAIIDHNTEVAIEYGKAAIDEGADAIQLCVDYGNRNGPWLHPEMFRRFVKPALKRHTDAFKKKGAFSVLHSDGYIMPILADAVDAGISSYQGIDSIAGMDLKKVKEEFGNRICLAGNVDLRVLEYGTKEDVANEVDRCIREGANGGGYVLCASANVSASRNAENFVYMLNYAREKGLYG